MSTNPFLKQNKKVEKPIEIYVSDNFVDSDGKRIPFILRIISSVEAERLTQECLEPTIDPVTHRKNGQEVNQQRLQKELLVKSIVQPDLEDKELQESWKAHNATDLLDKMLNVQERNTLLTEFDKYFTPVEQKSEEAEEETKNE